MGSDSKIELNPVVLLRAYAVGIFPMAESAVDDRLAWFDPDPRGILPLDAFHVPQRLARTIKAKRYSVTADADFASVIAGCGEATNDRPKTWINSRIAELCIELHQMGYAHSVEVWDGLELVGGLYGIALGGAFFGESMFSRDRDASKVALVHLVARLRHCGFVLLDTQFTTPHLAQFGAVEIPRKEYRRRLTEALRIEAGFHCNGAADAVGSLLQSITQIS